LGDQAALSALRGIVYQAQRDAKKKEKEEGETPRAVLSHEEQYKRLMQRLLEEEKREQAIRAASRDRMRPYEAEALLARYKGIQWHVTGNGNIEYKDGANGSHLFTDRGNRITFDRIKVTDQEIRLALVHAEQKFGKQITLTGDDPIFAARMARLADDMGLTVLNPELQQTIVDHRREQELVIANAEEPSKQSTEDRPIAPSNQPREAAEPIREAEIQHVADVPPPETPEPEPTTKEKLRARILSIDPRATFIDPDKEEENRTYIGQIAITLPSPAEGFAQHLGRSEYALHLAPTPTEITTANITIKYKNKVPVIIEIENKKGKGIAD
jgi:hypothetical protein